MSALIHFTACPPGSHAGIVCAVCGAHIRRRQCCVRVTSHTAGGLIAVVLHVRCHADLAADRPRTAA